MNQDKSVVFKGTGKGISVFLDENMSYAELKKKFAEKVLASGRFFEGAKSGILFEGRSLSEEEQKEFVDIISQHANMEVTSFQNEKASVVQKSTKKTKARKDIIKDKTVYYKNSIRSGQKVTADTSVVVIGDVNPGGEVIAEGNVTVLGALKGMAHAGSAGDKNAFVVAVCMQPIQLRIGDVIACFPKESENEMDKKPCMAYIVKGQMYIEPL